MIKQLTLQYIINLQFIKKIMAKSTPIPKGYSALLILSSTCYILMGLIFNTLTPYILRYLLDDN